MVQALYDLCEQICRTHYNQQRTIYRLTQTIDRYKNFLYEHHIHGLIDLDHDNDIIPLPTGPSLSKSQTNKKIAKLVNLIMSMDTSYNFAHNFVFTLIKRLMSKNIVTHDSIKNLLKPLIIRDVNQSIDDLRNDELRMTREAFNYKSQNISTRKTQKCRNAVT